MVDSQGDQEALTRAIERFSDKADRLLGVGNMNTAKIEINAGGIGVWIATTACFVTLAVTMVGAIFVTREFSRQDQQLQELREKDDIHDAWLQTINNKRDK